MLRSGRTALSPSDIVNAALFLEGVDEKGLTAWTAGI